MGYTITEGPHKGHHVVKDTWRIDFANGNPDTSWWCLTCACSIDGVMIEEESVEEVHADGSL